MNASSDTIEELFDAIRHAQRDRVEALLRSLGTAKVRDVLSGYTPLHKAASAGHVEIVALLIQFGADVDDSENNSSTTPLGTAATAGQLSVVKALLQIGAALHPNEIDIIQEARNAGDVEIAELLGAGRGSP